MTEATTLAAELRNRTGTGGARACRRAGQVPGIIYGDGKDSTSIAVAGPELIRHLKNPSFFAHVFELNMPGATERVLPRDLQVDPVTSEPLHIDFLRVSATSELSLDVSIQFVNESQSPGLKMGGVLNIVEHTVAIICRPDRIPEAFEVDLTGLEIGNVVHVDSLPLPDGVRLAPGQEGATIASIAQPTVEAAPEAEVEEEDEEDADPAA